MKNFKILVFGATVLFFASCTVTRPYAVTDNAIGDAVGTSKTTLIGGASVGNVLQTGLISTNINFGVIEAAKNGNVDKIATVDVQSTNFLLFSTVRIIVTGTESSN